MFMENSKTVFVAVVGKPNVGKSSLINALVGKKITIVSKKPQTTRNRIFGVLTKNLDQYVFLDTPGLFHAKDKLGQNMVKTVKDSVSSVDLIVMVVEPNDKISKAETHFISNFQHSQIPVILVINKIDLISNKSKLMDIISKYNNIYEFKSTFLISVLFKDGLEDLMQEIRKYLIYSDHFFPDDMVTDRSEHFIAAEILREKLLTNMREEIPHGTAVLTEKIREKGNILDIDCLIYCLRPNHKGMIIGKNGKMLKKIATEARLDMENFFKCRVNLKCWVKVKDDWKNKDNYLKILGLNANN